MKATITGVALLPVWALVLYGCGAESKPGADMVLTNANIYTVDEDKSWVEAVAIKDGRFVYVGESEGVEQYVGEATRTVDLAGRLVLPGLIDGHTHPGYIGVERFGPRLPTTSQEEMLAAVKAYSDANPGTGWIRMCCWSPRDYVSGQDGPHKRDLDGIVADRPVWINSRSWHSYWLNTKGLEALGVDRDTPDPRPGIATYVRDDNGDLTGWVKEGAGWQHFAEEFDVDTELHRSSMAEFLETLSEHGVTTVYDAGNFGYEDQVYGYLAELERAGELPLRYEGTYQVFTPERRDLAVQEMKRLRKTYGGDRLQFRTIKLFMDGINSNRSGGMLEPYKDNPDYIGQTMLTMEQLRDFLLELHEEKLDLHAHAIGDLSVRTVLDAVEAAQAAVSGDFYPRVSIAHLHQIDPADYSRFAELGVSANYTPWWHRMGRGDGAGPDPVLGEERYSRLFDVKRLIDTGANVTFSSDDWRLNVLTPFLGIQVGHVRQAPLEWLAEAGGDAPVPRALGPRNPGLDQMVKGYTINAAYPFRMEDQIGSIEAGKIADLVVIDEDIFNMSPYDIYKIKPAAVMFEGDFIHGEL